MLALGIETATWMGGVALVDDRVGVISERSLKSISSHSERLLPMIEELLKESQRSLDECSLICVSIGPGSFTGLRIGLAVAKGLAFAEKIPIIGVSTLEALAKGLYNTSLPVCPIIDARKKEIFTSLYTWKEGELVDEELELVIKPEDLIKKIKQKTIFVGDGVFIYKEMLERVLKDLAVFAPAPFNYIRAAIIADIGIKRFSQKNLSHDVDDLRPVYIRPSEAELNNRSVD